MPTTRKPKTLTAEEYAAHRGVTRQAVTRAIKICVLTEKAASKVGGRWRIDAKQADVDWGKRVQATKQRVGKPAASARKPRKPPKSEGAPPWSEGPSSDDSDELPDEALVAVAQEDLRKMLDESPGDMVLAQAVKHEADARLRQLRLDRETGVVLDARHVERVLFSGARAVLERMMQLPGSLAPEVSSMKDARAIERRMEEEIEAAFEGVTAPLPVQDA